MKSCYSSRVLAFLLFFGPVGHAQIIDDFSDGNFDQNPVWVGDAANFKISTSGELQLNATAAGQSALWVAGNLPDSSIWDMDVRLTFDPSNQNLLRIYLQSDQTDPVLANGYYLEMGETGSADALRFFRQDGGAKTLLATGTAGLAASSPQLHIRVTRTVSGQWTVEAATIGSVLENQLVVTDATWTGGANRFFGLQCLYTISNASKFFLDNVNIRPNVPDTQPPVLVSASAISAAEVTAVFNEDLDEVSAENPANYTVNNGIGQVTSAVLSGDKKTVTLSLPNALSTGDYTLQSSSVADILGNVSLAQTAGFQYVKIEIAEEFDVLFTEIMADPSPSAGLPELEWFEILNRSNKTIDLATLRFSDATSAPIALPTHLLQSGEYVAITALANVGPLQAAISGNVLGLGISASILNNESDVLTLTDASGKVIDRVSYLAQWHTDPGKEDGGFSLERTDPTLPCLSGENWQSSTAIIGGTPGLQNATFSVNPDVERPRVFKVFPESASSILITFSEGMDRSSVEDAAAYELDPNIAVASASQLPTDRAVVRLTLATPLQTATVYTLSVDISVEDCSGNAYLFVDTIMLGLAEKPDIQDIVINEILFNPASGGSRYVEFYNRSQKIFDWSDFFLASNSDSSTSVVQVLQDRLFLPGEYHVFSNDAAFVRENYANIVQKNVLQNSLPSLDDVADSIKIYWVGGGKAVTVDSFFYRRGMHNALLSTTEQEGVALERLRTETFTQDPSNWTSASPFKTGAPGTPTLPNSQTLGNADPGQDLISIPLARLSPDGDGREDFLEIFYQLPNEGYAASLNIFDSDGNPVKTLVRQNLIGTAGSVRWDGDTDGGIKARPGIHVLYFEVFSPEGVVKRVKKTVALIGRF